MAWPGTLTAEEQQVVQVFVDQLFRPDVLRVVQALNISVGIKEEWDNRIQAMFTKLAAGDVIPNGSNLAGAQAMTKSEVTAILTTFGALLTTNNTAANRAQYAKAIGGVNMIRE
jgi:hypothetical protein